ncbi:MAG: NAD-dependent epimerase/dehydratase family protein [Armatimonadota bacterium]|nr:NAD-dependent epimerase/dehydratase family protein [Armatimonadota bacterium]
MGTRAVLITGATGAVGCRLAEIGTARGLRVVGVVRAWERAARLARLPIRIMRAEMGDLRALRAAMDGVDVIFHCALDTRVPWRQHRRINAHGTRAVMQAALDVGVHRVVHLSSVAVYSYRPDPRAATEEGPYRYTGHPYCDGKIDAEKIVFRYHRRHGLPVVILRPTWVYGPFTNLTETSVESIIGRRLVLVDGGRGICNCVYIDNLVDAMLLAAETDDAVGDVFHVSDAEPQTWGAFLEAHARALGEGFWPLPLRSREEVLLARRERMSRVLWRLEQSPWARRAWGAVAGFPPAGRGWRWIRPLASASVRRLLARRRGGGAAGRVVEQGLALSQTDVDVYTMRVVYSIEKARRVLGYTPGMTFSEAMEVVRPWIRWWAAVKLHPRVEASHALPAGLPYGKEM